MYAYSNDGFSFRAVSEDYEAQAGEVLFAEQATPDQIINSFAGHATKQAAQAWALYQAESQTALDATDLVAIRCIKAGVIFPAEWLQYVEVLRSIMAASTGTPGTLPSRPAYPLGT